MQTSASIADDGGEIEICEPLALFARQAMGTAVTTIMELSDGKEHFRDNFDKLFGKQKHLPFGGKMLELTSDSEAFPPAFAPPFPKPNAFE